VVGPLGFVLNQDAFQQGTLLSPVLGMATTSDGKGYWLVAATAGLLTYGDAVSYGPSPNTPPFSPTSAIARTPDGKGYWLLQPDDVSTSFVDVEDPGSSLGRAVVAAAASQVGPDPNASQGSFCNPYGPCEEWCALFATWAWEQAGIAVPRYAFTGDIYEWAAKRGATLPSSAHPEPGDDILFGTGPQSVSTSLHVGIVAEAWPDGAVVTIEGDSGPEPAGRDAVTMDGPYLVTQAASEVGRPVYAIAHP
jgi:hypothetical protein